MRGSNPTAPRRADEEKLVSGTLFAYLPDQSTSSAITPISSSSPAPRIRCPTPSWSRPTTSARGSTISTFGLVSWGEPTELLHGSLLVVLTFIVALAVVVPRGATSVLSQSRLEHLLY